ncbi:uncharacterized protein LOC115783919 [Archocentrus centrarchus]|uniref:uncharacterized protein LOC115783919 n=1 Tax=Archocentrus centrarchus TaxID=63155 RepID=UPI0011EA1FC8|nr:uncharacterized protein LOC115783919 [Archocentrus centrarchus]
MAEPGRTVRVSGLPTNIEDDRLKDKLLIHFLRNRNGGGEVDSATLLRATPVSALITFEESRVAQRVIQHSPHILEVDGKKSRLTVTEHRENLDPDQVILSLSATVDYSKLPGGVMALTSLLKSHRDVQINYTASEKSCTLFGSYSTVQAALAQLLGPPGDTKSAEYSEASGQPASSGSWSVQKAQKHHTQDSEDQSGKANKHRDKKEKIHTDRPSDNYNSSSKRDLTPGGYTWEDTGQSDGAALQLPATSVEDFSLIMDADMFQYLQKHCQKEYQHILKKYGVEVVDVTNHGLTTLFLHAAAAVRELGREQEYLKFARKALIQLYEENEAKICRSHMPKDLLEPSGGLQRAIENLSVRLPKVILNEDEKNIYIIGSSSDVSEAKQVLLIDSVKQRDKKEDVASLLRFPSYDSGSYTHADEERVTLPTSSAVGSVDNKFDEMLKSEEDERRAEGARRYKLAARFKDSGLVALSNRPTDFTLRTNSSPSKQARQGPVLGYDVLSETAGISAEEISRAVPQNTGGDILFKSGFGLPSLQTKTQSLNPGLTDTRPKNFSTTQSSLPGSPAPQPAGSGSTLKRASSFSGTPQQKAQVTGQKSQDDSSKSTVRARGRSSSFSTQTGMDKQEVYTEEFNVSNILWRHIREAYSYRVEDLTSDVQLKESHLAGSHELTVTIKGAKSSKVSSSQLGLQKLIDSVRSDFSVQKLPLSELGVSNAADETLQACCSEVRSRFKKVTIQILTDTLFLLGPQQLCSQVGATLREVFSGDSAQMSDQYQHSPTSFQMNEDKTTSLHFNSKSQVMLESQTGKADGTSRSQEWWTTYRSDFGGKEIVNGSFSQPPRKDHVIKEKVKAVDTMEMDGQKIGPFVSQSTPGNDSVRCVNGVGPTEKETTLPATQIGSVGEKEAEIQSTPEESGSGQRGLGGICVCGENGTSVLRTKCGATVCSKCLETVHARCRVCHETEQTPQGIWGKSSKSKLNISLPGHSKVCTIKITYSIPDGIQADGHPSPGKPFKGGRFEAYFPDCWETRMLLPRLEKAFRQGLTFTVTGKGTNAKVTWDGIPHKTRIQGGRSGNGYPDATYLLRLSEVLTSAGIEEPTEKSHD